MSAKRMLLPLCVALAGCASQPGQQDPLKNTKKLAIKAHTDLYHNGKFEIPGTTIHIIPPVHDSWILITGLAGMGASQSFHESFKHAQESAGLIKAGVRKSAQAASAVQGASMQVVQGELKVAKFGVDTLKTGPGVTSGIVAASVTFAGEVYDATRDAGRALAEKSVAAGKDMSEGATQTSAAVWSGTKETAKAGGALAEGSVAASKELSEGTTPAAAAAAWSGTKATADAGGTFAEDAVAAGKQLSEGTKPAAAAVWSGTKAAAKAGGAFAEDAIAAGKELSEGTTQASAAVWSGTKAAAKAGGALAEDAVAAGKELSEGTTQASAAVWSGTKALADETSEAGQAAAGHHFSRAHEYILGYATGDVRDKLAQRAHAISDSASWSGFVDAFRHSNEWREAQAAPMTDLWGRTWGNYAADAGAPFREAGKEMSRDALEKDGTFALIKSLSWVLQGVFWDATVKPTGKLAGASLGYIVVNGMVVPVLVAREAGAVANVAVQVTWNSAASVYDVTAPTATAALAGLFGAVELGGGKALAGGELVGGGAATAATYVGGKAAAGATAVGGYVAGKTVQSGAYVAGSAATAGTYVGGQAAAGATAVGGYVAGKAVQSGAYVAGSAATAGTYVGGQAAAGATAVGGYVAGKAVQSGAYVAGSVATAGTYVGGQAAAGATAVGGYAAGKTVQSGAYVAGLAATAGTYVGGQTAAGVTGGAGYLAGWTVQYVAAPLSAAGIAGGGAAIGVVTGGATSLAGAGVATTGAVATAGTYVSGGVAAGTVLAGGSVASIATGGALGTYELSKAVVVPAGHEVGAGVVLGYDAMSQLGAHAVYAVADASYMVLSLEGPVEAPKWVLYAIMGKLGKGEDLPPGAIVDLKGMRAAGETLIAVPASPEEVKRVVDAVPGQLPVMRQADQSQPEIAHLEAAQSQPVQPHGVAAQPVQPQPVQSQPTQP